MHALKRRFQDRALQLAMGLLCAVALQGCSQNEPVTDKSVLRPPVLVASIGQKDVAERIQATGQLTAKASATIASQVPGQIQQIRAREGEAVEAGAVLLVIDPERRKLEVANAEAQLAKAKAEFAVATRKYQRTQSLSQHNAASEAQLDEDRAGRLLANSTSDAAAAQLGLARLALANSTVRAPFTGLIARRYVSAGEYLSIGTSLFDLVALDPVEVEFTLAEIDSSKVALGQPVEVSLAPYSNQTFAANVKAISPTIDPRTRTLRVKAELPNPDGRLRPGLFAHIDLGVSHRQAALVVPEEAIVQRADGAVIFRLTASQHVQRVPVETGVNGDGWIEIRQGLEPGDQIVIRGQAHLDDGVAVSVRQVDGSLADASALGARGQGGGSRSTP